MGGSAATPANTGMHTGFACSENFGPVGAVASSLNYNGNDIGVEQTTTEGIGNGPLSAINTSASQLTYHSNKSGHHTLKLILLRPFQMRLVSNLGVVDMQSMLNMSFVSTAS